MPFSLGNPRFRTKDQMTEDASFVLSSNVSYGCKYSVLHQITWEWTEFEGKVKGMTLWSENAFDLYLDNNYSESSIRHEHVVPRKSLIKGLLDNMDTKTDKNTLYEYFDHYLIGCIVTLDEALLLDNTYKSYMPPEFYDKNSVEYKDRWLRYKRNNIDVYKIEWDDKKRNRDIYCNHGYVF